MLGYLWLAVKITVFVLIAAWLHYTLPDRDIVRITDTETRRIDFGENSIFWASPDSGNAVGTPSRDVFFIQAVRPNGSPRVYRNEDTSAGWPPYFKFDTQNLQALAADYRSTRDDPRWVAIRHYGWRNEFLSIFPNAIAITPVEGPDVRLIPWFNIVFLTVLFALWWAAWVRWRRFKANRITPRIERMDAAIDERTAATGRWFRSFGRKP